MQTADLGIGTAKLRDCLAPGGQSTKLRTGATQPSVQGPRVDFLRGGRGVRRSQFPEA